MMYDGLFCAFDVCAMGAGTEKYTKAADGITRDRQDAFAATSHERASAAMKEGRFADEIVPVRCRSARATRSSSRPTRACVPARRPRASAGCAPRSTPTARSPRATPARSPTAARPSIVMSKAEAERRGVDAAGRGRELRPGRRSRRVAAHPAVARHQPGAREGGQGDRRRRPVRDQRGLRRGRPGVDGRPRHHRRDRSTSTVAPSPSVTRSACRAPAWR